MTARDSAVGGLAELASVVWCPGGAASHDRDAAAEIAHSLALFCDEILWAGLAPATGVPGHAIEVASPGGALDALVAGLAATDRPRLLFAAAAEAPRDPDALLALLAHPRCDLVWQSDREGTDPVLLLCARDAVTEAAIAQRKQGECGLSGLIECVDAVRFAGLAD
ncbi:MAG: hypothetical protein VCB78_01475 [Myxococcota bacterium]